MSAITHSYWTDERGSDADVTYTCDRCGDDVADGYADHHIDLCRPCSHLCSCDRGVWVANKADRCEACLEDIRRAHKRAAWLVNRWGKAKTWEARMYWWALAAQAVEQMEAVS